MLTELRIRHIGVIDDAELEFGPGFTAITGETGAGKTMVVTGLALLLGGKSDPRLIRTGAAKALVEGRFEAPPEIVAAAQAAGAELDGDELLITRHLTSSRSRTYVGGAAVPLATASALLGEWVTLHGQSEQLRLSTPDRQRQVLDQHAGGDLAGILADYRAAYAERARLAAELAELQGQDRERARELDLLRFGLGEIERVAPQPGEDTALAAEAKRLQAADDLRLAARQAITALAGDEHDFDAPNATALIAEAQKLVAHAAGADSTLDQVAARVQALGYELADVAGSLASYLADLEADPNRLEWIAARQSELQHLTRKYGADCTEVLAWAEQAATRVGHLQAGEQRIPEVRAAVVALDSSLATLAAEITARRIAAAASMAAAATAELAALALPHAVLEFSVRPLAKLGPDGGDEVALLFAANPGMQPGPLGRVASGGELSRVRLAIEVVLAGDTPGQVFIFDEVDAGIGGAVALEVGRRLRRLARHSQVIVVTHLAQVAAFADRQFVVAKAAGGQVTTSGIEEVQGHTREGELARMMGGENTASARERAAELLQLSQ